MRNKTLFFVEISLFHSRSRGINEPPSYLFCKKASSVCCLNILLYMFYPPNNYFGETDKIVLSSFRYLNHQYIVDSILWYIRINISTSLTIHNLWLFTENFSYLWAVSRTTKLSYLKHHILKNPIASTLYDHFQRLMNVGFFDRYNSSNIFFFLFCLS